MNQPQIPQINPVGAQANVIPTSIDIYALAGGFYATI
jgi:hypothetical protein